jgi:hypothetical protein
VGVLAPRGALDDRLLYLRCVGLPSPLHKIDLRPAEKRGSSPSQVDSVDGADGADGAGGADAGRHGAESGQRVKGGQYSTHDSRY